MKMKTIDIDHEIFKNEKLVKLGPLTRILYQGLKGLADKTGRLEDQPDQIKAHILPFDECNITGMLNRLHKAGFIVRYQENNDMYIHIVNCL